MRVVSKERRRDRDAEIMREKAFSWVSADLAGQARSGDVNDITAVDSRLQSDYDDFACAYTENGQIPCLVLA